MRRSIRWGLNQHCQAGFGYDGLDLVGEYASDGSLLRRYVHVPGIDRPIVWYEGAGTSDRRYLHADERGSIVAVTNNAGTSIGINTYDAWGIPGSANVGRFGYTGQVWLPEIGMWYYKARMYSPTLGRFMQTDPIGYADGLNWYAYVGNDPVNKVDPLGLCSSIIGHAEHGMPFEVSNAPCGSNQFDENSFDCGDGACRGLFSLGAGSPFGGGGGGGAPSRPGGAQNGEGCDQRLLNFANRLSQVGDQFNSVGDKGLILAGTVAVAGAVTTSTVVGAPAGLSAGAVAGSLASASVITKGIGSVLEVGAHVAAISATSEPDLIGPAIFNGVAGILPFKLGPAASYFQDKVVDEASSLVGFGNIPATCR